MSKLFWSTWILYLTAAGGYGGWRGRDLWSAWGVWCLLLPPLALAAFTSLRSWRSGGHIQAAVVMSVFAVVAIGGSVLGLVWGIAEATGRWSAEPTVRAMAGMALAAAGCALALAYKQSQTPGEPRQTGRRGM